MAEVMQTFRIKRIFEYGTSIRSFRFERLWSPIPGQFFNIWLPGVDEKPFSVSGLFQNEIEFTVKAVGPFTRKMMELRAGDWLGLRGPFGNGFNLVDKALLVAGGMGIAPMRFVAQKLKTEGKNFSWIAAAKTSADFPFLEDLKNFTETIIVTEDGSIGKKGLATDFIPEIIEAGLPRVVMGVGPEKMLLEVYEIAKSYDLPVQLSFERYMKCGIGICGQCCLDGPGIRLCVEGPILSNAQISQVTEWGLPHRGHSGKRKN